MTKVEFAKMMATDRSFRLRRVSATLDRLQRAGVYSLREAIAVRAVFHPKSKKKA